MTACDRCHRRKTRCDRNHPECGACVKSRSRCMYPDDFTYRQAQRDHVKAIEQRLLDLERENQQLRTERQSSNSLPPRNSTPDNTSPGRYTGFLDDPSSTTLPRDNSQDSATQDSSAIPSCPTDAVVAAHLATPANTTSLSERANATSIGDAPDCTVNQPNTTNTTNITHALTPASQRSSGSARYLGTSAGIEFVDLVERVVESPNPHGDLFARVTDAYCKPTIPAPNQAISALIPDRATAAQLISSYFGHWHLTFPLLYRPEFLRLVDHIYEDPTFQERNPHCAFTFNIILALGSATSKRFEWSFKDTESYYMRAMTHFDEILGYRDIRTLQALLLCCQYGIHASLRDTSNEMWDLLGKAERICVEIGLHQLKSAPRKVKCDIHLTGPLPQFLQTEMQRRCFWCFYSLDRIVSITLDRPLTPHDDDIETPLPSPLDDDDLKAHYTSQTPSTQPRQTQLSPFLQLIHIRKILSRIHRSFYTSIRIRSLPLPEKLALRNSLMHELEDWRNNISSIGLPSYQDSSPILSAFSYPSWYQALYHGAVLLMFRPSGAFGHEGSQLVNGEEDVLRMTWESSRAIIKRYKEVLQARRLNYSWICLYTIFMAGLANVYSMGRSAQRRKLDPNTFLPDCADAVEDVRDCSNILTAICERWDDARNSCEVFNRLSSSAFKELLKAHSHYSDPRQFSLTSNPNVFDAPTDGDEIMSYSNPPNNLRSSNGQEQERNIQFVTSTSTLEHVQPLEEVSGFQDFFQDMQSTLYGEEYNGPNEVMMGLHRDWFE